MSKQVHLSIGKDTPILYWSGPFGPLPITFYDVQNWFALGYVFFLLNSTKKVS